MASDKDIISRRDKWIQFAIPIVITLITLLVGLGVAWGAYSTKIKNLEEKVNSTVSDHDVLISLNTKMDLVITEIGELKQDLKKHLERSDKTR